MTGKIVAILLLTTAYAVVRYNVVGDVAWAQAPVFVLNKAVSWSAVVFLLLAARGFFRQDRERAKFWGRLVLHGSLVHVLMSLVLVSRAYYGKLYGNGMLSAVGEWHFLFGVAAAYLFWVLQRYDEVPAPRRGGLKVLACAFVFGHVLCLGIPGWWTPGGWPGGLPPISMLSGVLALVALGWYAAAKGRHGVR